MKRSVFAAAALAATTATLAAPSSALAQEYLIGGAAQVSSGAESGGGGFQRARTRIRVGADLRVDEAPNDGIAIAGIVDVEPHVSVGADVRYLHLFGEHFAVTAGGIGYVAPRTLVGGVAGAEFRISLGKTAAFTIGPEITAFVAGADLPDGGVLFQALVDAGVHVNF